MKILILGITGQDGVILALNLLERGYHVVGVARGNRFSNKLLMSDRFTYLSEASYLKICASRDFWDGMSTVINFFGQTSVSASFLEPVETINSNIQLELLTLDAIRLCSPATVFVNALSSEMFAPSERKLQEESDLFPNSPYSAGKICSKFISESYRDSFDLCVVNLILFNHESPLRKSHFVTQKIVESIYHIKKGELDTIVLGNVDVVRDWSWAVDFMGLIIKIIENPECGTFNVCSGRSQKLYDYLVYVSEYYNLNIQDYLISDDKNFRVREVLKKYGDNRKARKTFDWKPSHSLEDIAHLMAKFCHIRHEQPSEYCRELKKELLIK
ncbi:GDP-mannose 4,6-dehydratase [Planktomarina temperata]|nr:GDP-mannose 4,6-dehydratase [Planktomarina temperata]